MKRDVFISYSRRNIELVKGIKSEIDAQCGTDCWIDLKGIESGSEMFLRDIVGGIDACKVFLFMLSRESMESEYALLELNYAKEQGKRVVLVNIDDCRMTGVFLFKYSLTDTIAWNNPPQREKLLRDVKRWVGNGQPSDSSPVSAQQDPLQVIEERIAQLDKEVGELKTCIDSNGKYGFKNLSGRVVIPCQWAYAVVFSEGLASVQDSSGKYGYIDKSGRMVIPCQWASVGNFKEGVGLAYVKDSSGKYGYIDKSGRMVIPCQWTKAWSFCEGLASVRDSSGRWGYIDKSGREVIPCQWAFAWNFSEGLASVQDSSGKRWNIDKTGKVVGED